MAVTVVMVAENAELYIGSAVLKIWLAFSKELGNRISIAVIDNGSMDGTSKIASIAGAKVYRYHKRQPMGVIWKKAMDVCIAESRRINVFFDPELGGTVEDVIEIVKSSIEKGEVFAAGYSYLSGKSIGCAAFDYDLLITLREKEVYLQDVLQDLLRSGRFNVSEIEKAPRAFMKGRYRIKVSLSKLRGLRKRLIDDHPLRFYGFFALIFVIFGVAAGFYTVNHFYKEMELYYPTIMLTAVFLITGSFIAAIGVILNSLNMIVEKVKDSKKLHDVMENLK